jgi:hypothetical protein
MTRIDGELALIDGHSRALAALMQGETEIEARYAPLEAIEGATALYVHIHRAGPARGVRGVADLSDRVVAAEEHQRLWVGYCSAWLAAREEPSASCASG